MLKGCENCSTFLVRKFAVLFHLGQSKSHHFPTLGAIYHERQEKKTHLSWKCIKYGKGILFCPQCETMCITYCVLTDSHMSPTQLMAAEIRTVARKE